MLAARAMERRTAGERGFILETALEFGVSAQVIKSALYHAGIKPTRKGKVERTYEDFRPRLTAEERAEITWCPECGNIHVFMPCEWCANWRVAKQSRAGQQAQATRKWRKKRRERRQYHPFEVP